MKHIPTIAALIFLGACMFHTPETSILPIVLGGLSALVYNLYARHA